MANTQGAHHAPDPYGQMRPLRDLGWASEYLSGKLSDDQTLFDARVAGSVNLEFAHILQEDAEDACSGHDPYFCLGVSAKPATNGMLEVDFGEGLQVMKAPPAGVYLNAPQDNWTRMIGRAELCLLEMPMDELATFLQMDAADVMHSLRPLHDHVVGDDPVIRPLSLSLWEASKTPWDHADLFIDQGLQTLALYLMALARGAEWTEEALRKSDQSVVADMGDARIKRVTDYIEEHLATPIRVTDLASVAGMSNSQFSRAFKPAMGEAAWTYVRRRRVEAARRLLANSRMPIAEIAFATGFSSQAHLTNAFVDHFGMPPGQFRTKHGASAR